MGIREALLKILSVAKTPKAKHHLQDKSRKGWYEVCTTRTVCAEGKRQVNGKLTLYLSEKELYTGWHGYSVDIYEKEVYFESPEHAEATLKRLQELVPVLQEVVARMKAEQ